MIPSLRAAIGTGCLLCSGAASALPPIIAHRGASLDAPENTIPAFNLAWNQEADGIEADFHLTKDGKIVCAHDPGTKRTAGKSLKIASSTLAELRSLDVGSWKGDSWKNTRMPTMDEVLATVPKGKRIFVEIKCGPEILPALKTTLENSGLSPSQVVIISFDTALITGVKQQLPRFKALWITDIKTHKITGSVTPTAREILATLEKTGADGVDCRAHPAVDHDFVKILHSARKEVHTWTVDDPLVAQRLIRAGIDSLTSNRAGWMKSRIATDGGNERTDATVPSR